MKFRRLMTILTLILIATLPSLGQHQPPLPFSFRPQLRLLHPMMKFLQTELIRMQMELSRIAQDMDSVDAKMMLGIANIASSGNPKTISEAHELLFGLRCEPYDQGFYRSCG